MWDQTLRIGLARPFGTGIGSFRDTIQGFQRYPTINFSSAHNFVIEVFATQGWLGVALLLAVILSTFLHGWNDPKKWPLALGVAGLWATMAFDISWSMPVIPLLAFFGMGSLRASGAAPRDAGREVLAVKMVVLISAVALTAYWYLPCDSMQCVLGRHAGFRPR